MAAEVINGIILQLMSAQQDVLPAATCNIRNLGHYSNENIEMILNQKAEYIVEQRLTQEYCDLIDSC